MMGQINGGGEFISVLYVHGRKAGVQQILEYFLFFFVALASTGVKCQCQSKVEGTERCWRRHKKQKPT